MLMKKIKFLCFAFLVSIALNSCSKYDEGPCISFKSMEKRLIGLWEFSSISVNSVEYITQYKDSCNLKLSISGNKEELFIILVEYNRNSPQLSSSIITISDDGEEITFALPEKAMYSDITQSFYEIIPAFAEKQEWEINRLTSKELFLSATYKEQPYVLKLEKTKKYIFNQ